MKGGKADYVLLKLVFMRGIKGDGGEAGPRAEEVVMKVKVPVRPGLLARHRYAHPHAHAHAHALRCLRATGTHAKKSPLESSI